MKRYSDLEYLCLSKNEKFLYKLASFFVSIPRAVANLFIAIGRFFKNAGLAIGRELADIVMTFVKGDWKTKISYVAMGFGSIARGQVLRGLLFLLFEAVFVFYMITSGGYWMSLLPSLGKVGPHMEYNAVLDTHYPVYGDNSFKILLYGVLTIFFIIAFIYTWRMNVKQNKIAEDILRSGKKLKSGKEVDFIEGDALVGSADQLVQVAYSVADSRTLERETSALREAMARFGVREGAVVTVDDESIESYPEGTVRVLPAWKWLLR